MGVLDGRIVVVTGASRGIGRACALAFARAGARVAALARTAEAIASLADEIGRGGGKALPLQADVGSPSSVASVFTEIERQLGPVDVLLNNAAILGPAADVVDMGVEAWLETYRINILGTMLCCRAVLPSMIERRTGKIINVSSGAAQVPIAGYTAYSSSKAAVSHFTLCLAEEVKRFGINVNCVNVWARTAMWDGQRAAPMPAVAEAMARGWSPTAEENVDAILFLASAASNHVTGQILASNSLPAYEVPKDEG